MMMGVWTSTFLLYNDLILKIGIEITLDDTVDSQYTNLSDIEVASTVYVYEI